MATSGFLLLGAQPLDLAARVRQRTTQNVDMAIEPEEGGKLAHERLQSALLVRTKTRRQTITPTAHTRASGCIVPLAHFCYGLKAG